MMMPAAANAKCVFDANSGRHLSDLTDRHLTNAMEAYSAAMGF
jgi:hypothetical protein